MGNQHSGARPEVAIELTSQERQTLQELSRSRTAQYREVIRARALIGAADWLGNRAIGRLVWVDERTVRTWRQEFVQRRLECLRDRKRSGRQRTFEPRVRAALTHLACQKPGTHVGVPVELVEKQKPGDASAPGQPEATSPEPSIEPSVRSAPSDPFLSASVQKPAALEATPTAVTPDNAPSLHLETVPVPPSTTPPQAAPAAAVSEAALQWRGSTSAAPPSIVPPTAPPQTAPRTAPPSTLPPATASAPFSRFSAAILASLLVRLTVVASISVRTVGRWLKQDRLKPWRFRSWITPKDLHTFLQRACPVLALYERVRKNLLEPGEEVHSLDEKTSIQARHHATYRASGEDEPAHLEHTYKRGGAVNLLAALNVATGLLFGEVYPQKRFAEFSSFLSTLIQAAVARGAHRIHLVLDNGSLHRPAYLSTWLAQQFPDVEVVVHWLPVRSSWLNQIEIYFGILQRQALTPNDFPHTAAVGERILAHIVLRNQNPKPIQWSYTSEKLRAKYEPRLKT